MNFRKKPPTAGIVFFTVALSAAAFLGCSIDSGESSSRVVNLIVQGFYSGSNGVLVQNNTGSPISTMDLRQSGDKLEGVDNNGIIFKGSIGRVDDSTQQASFTLAGSTTAGMEGTMAGVIDVEGTSAKMQGTWAEPTLFSTFSGTATVPQTPTNSPGTGVSITSGGGSLTVGIASSFSANESATWSSTVSGSFSPTTGSSTDFTPSITGSGTVTATTDGGSDSVSITVN